MHKFVFAAVLGTAVVVLTLAVTAEAAWPVKAVRVLGPRVKVMVDKTSNLIWRNKGTITTGVLLTTFATNPEPFVEGATTVACTTAEKTIETVVPKVTEQIREPTSKTGAYMILAGILAAIGTIIVFRRRFQAKLFGPVVVFLIVFFIICCCGVAVRADTVDVISEAASTGVVGWARWQVLWNLLLLLLLLPIGTG